MSMLIALAFAGLCIYIAYCGAMELFIAWYSGCEDQITPAMWWLAVTRSAAALVVAVTTLAMAWKARG
jgi:hypothetical protein